MGIYIVAKFGTDWSIFADARVNKVKYGKFFNSRADNSDSSGPINPFPNKPWFLRVCSTSLLKTLWEKEKLLVTSNFSFFHSVFYRFGELSSFFITFKSVVCKLFQFGRV